MFLIFGAALMFFVPGLRDSTRTQTRIDLQQEATTASYRLLADLELCTPSGLAISQTLPSQDPGQFPPGSRIGMQPVVDLTADVPPAPIYDVNLHLYWWDSQQKCIFQWTGVSTQFNLDTSVPHRCSSQELQDLISGASLHWYARTL
jgi:hypothetical protein